MNAMINLYRDFLKNNPPLQKEALNMVFDTLTRAMETRSMQTLIDIYLNFFKGSEQQETALLLLQEFTQELIQQRNIEDLNKILTCFEGTSFQSELQDTIAAIALQMGAPAHMGAAAAAMDEDQTASPRQIVYDQWQAACTNQDIGILLNLKDEAVRLGVVELYDAEAIIQSLMPN